MIPDPRHYDDQPPHVTRLCKLAPLTPDEIRQLTDLCGLTRIVPARREIAHDREPVRQGSIILSGFAARVRHFRDGRRQILHLLLPGDVVDWCQWAGAVRPTTITALSDVKLALLPHAGTAGLEQAYVQSNALEQGYMFRHLARLGRFDAYERLADLLLDLHARMAFAGLAEGDSFSIPLTQEMLADTLGLTGVHINRTLQAMRKDAMVERRGNAFRFLDGRRLRSMVDYQPLAITG